MATSVEDTVRTRTESDSMGTIEVPANVYWGAQTQRSLIHFNIGGDKDRMPTEVYRAYGVVKKAAAQVNTTAGRLPRVSRDGRTLLFLLDDRGKGRLRQAALQPDGSLGPSLPVFQGDEGSPAFQTRSRPDLRAERRPPVEPLISHPQANVVMPVTSPLQPANV